MKKRIIIFALSLMAFTGVLHAQNMYDALRFSQEFYSGTARSMGLGNAMVSLGADAGALAYNPAASALYKYTELAFSLGYYNNMNNETFLGNTFKNSKGNFEISNVSVIQPFSTGYYKGLTGVSFSIAFNTVNDYTFMNSVSGSNASSSYLASLAASIPKGVTPDDLTMTESNPYRPFDYTNASWESILGWNTGLIDTTASFNGYLGATENIGSGKPVLGGRLNQKFYNSRSGTSNNVAFNFSGTVDDIFYFGVNLNIKSINYYQLSVFSEEAEDPSKFETGFQDFKTQYSQSTSGLGVSLSAGFIYKPVVGLSIGGSISSPTWLSMKDTWEISMSGYTAIYKGQSISSPMGVYNYHITTPIKWNLGVSYILGGRVALALDYEGVNYSGAVMSDANYNRNAFVDDNRDIANTFRTVSNFRFGAEFRATPVFYIRGGYNFYDSSIREFDNSRHYACVGLGYRSQSGFFFDLAFQMQCNRNSESYTLYNSYEGVDAPMLTESANNLRALMSIGIIF